MEIFGILPYGLGIFVTIGLTALLLLDKLEQKIDKTDCSCSYVNNFHNILNELKAQ